MENSTQLTYLGWSAFILTENGSALSFDPNYKHLYTKNWASLDDYAGLSVICVTHGHSDHYNDVAKIANYTGAKVISSHEICSHLNKNRNIPNNQLLPLKPHEEIEINNYIITPFTWRHREINFLRLLRADFFSSARFAIINLLKVPFKAPYYGFHVKTPKGLKLTNYCEGFSNAMDLAEVKNLSLEFETDVLLAGAQLNFESHVAQGAEVFSPSTVVLFHPHQAMFDRIKLASSPPETFKEKVHQKLPNARLVYIEPRQTINLNTNKGE